MQIFKLICCIMTKLAWVMSLALGCGWEESNLKFPSHPGHTHFPDYDTFGQTNHAAQLLWVIVMYWHAQNAREPTFVFWKILMVLLLHETQVIYIFIYKFICRCSNKLKI